MNIDDLTLGQIKQITSMVGNQTKSSLLDDYIGKYVIVRSSNEGVNAGVVKRADDTGIVLTNARRFWYHKPAEKSVCWYEGVAKFGLGNSSKISCEVEEKAIIERYSITICTPTAEGSIRGMKAHEQS